MRIIQIIDSLEVGGAERIAVNYANALAEKIEFSGLVATRKEGPLLNQMDQNVSYLFLNKKGTIDFAAIFRLRKYVTENKVTIIHAHATSFFTAVLLKIVAPQIDIIWHDHYGARVNDTRNNNFILFLSSFFFSAIFVVNLQLQAWALKTLLTKKVFYLPNFAMSDIHVPKETFLKGDDEKRIICVANLKKPKNHIAILIAFQELKLHKLGWSLHLIGKDYEDGYSRLLKEFLKTNNLENYIFIYNSRNDIQHVLSQATIGILASTQEGFPVALLEYGLARLAVISTNVGYCPEIVKEGFSGLLFNPSNTNQLQQQLYKMISYPELRASFGLHLQQLVLSNYSKASVVTILLKKYKIV